jgi:hypothetical protein
MPRLSSPSIVLAVAVFLALPAGTAQAGRRKLKNPVPDAVQTAPSAAPRTFWGFLTKANAAPSSAKVKNATPVTLDRRGVVLPGGVLPSRRPLGPAPIIVISPPRPVVSNT